MTSNVHIRNEPDPQRSAIVTTTGDDMTEQMEAFPSTTLDVLAKLAEYHRAEYGKAVDSLAALGDDEKIARAYEKAEEKVASRERLVLDIDAAVEREQTHTPITRGPDVARSVMQEAADIVNSGALDHDGCKVTMSRAHAVDPITGEVESVYPQGGTVPAVVGDRPASDCTGCGKPMVGVAFYDDSRPYHEGCWRALPGNENADAEDATHTVFALYPGSDEPHETVVGSRTRYGELVADYLTAAGIDGEVDADEWEVLASDELTKEGGGYRSLKDAIDPGDYGRRLLVAAADQGSVTGTPEHCTTCANGTCPVRLPDDAAGVGCAGGIGWCAKEGEAA